MIPNLLFILILFHVFLLSWISFGLSVSEGFVGKNIQLFVAKQPNSSWELHWDYMGMVCWVGRLQWNLLVEQGFPSSLGTFPVKSREIPALEQVDIPGGAAAHREPLGECGSWIHPSPYPPGSCPCHSSPFYPWNILIQDQHFS